ncbi:lymphocyte antigen 6A-2/6E-1-like [Acomys russatus]|uniref:lymphocyte antigen 6A-2/6E-1-like n=1 Tax=Acomys russatus TaxID=60746 RepID=UPI0021E27D91|nr:lymphocyte antigen 6A-2/6E-1-like [Acomys russatus]
MKSSHATKSCVLILLVALLCTERAQGLHCYSCWGATSETSCQSLTCPYPDGVCVTHDVEALVGSQKLKVKNKSCLPTCPDNLDYLDNTQIMGADIRSNISCCKEDLCNAAVPTGGSTWTLAGVLLFSLASVLLLQALL